jgi:rhodanese-related sulfurtransferase
MQSVLLKNVILIILSAFSFLNLFQSTAEAIPPPEILRLGPVFAQMLALILVFFSTVLFFIRDRLRSLFLLARGRWGRKLVFMLLPLGAVIIALVISSAYVKKKNQQILDKVQAAKNTATVSDGVVKVAGMEFDIADSASGLSPQETAKLLGNKNYIFIDVREPIEFKIKHIPGFLNIRVGDLITGKKYQTLDKNKKLVLICEVGERGSNIAVFLRVKGYQAYYVNGGIDRWINNNLTIVGNKRGLLPDYRNKEKALDRDEVKGMVFRNEVIMVDVRVPTDYKKSHLDGAINIPIANLPSSDLDAMIGLLPAGKRVACVSYDRFGFYYCKILGYMVDQRKMSFGGHLQLYPGDKL